MDAYTTTRRQAIPDRFDMKRFIEKLKQIVLFRRAKLEACQQRAFSCVKTSYPGVGALIDAAPTCRIMIDHVCKRGNAAVVHVRRSHRDIPQARSAKPAVVIE